MLFSATQTRKTEDLARISLKKEPLYIGIDDHKDAATVQGLKQVPSQIWLAAYYVSVNNCIFWSKEAVYNFRLYCPFSSTVL